MKTCLAATILLVTLPTLAAAEQSLLCQSLSRRLAAVPTVIGSTAEVRHHAEALRRQEDEVRALRTQMRRSGCGAGSIVSFGRSDDRCGEIAEALRKAEAQREAVRSQRTASLSIIRPSGERNAILATMRENGCADPVAAPETVAADPLAPIPMETTRRSTSSITRISPKPSRGAVVAETAAAPPPPSPAPERPYDPSKKVRSVGPAFLPDDSSIDLGNPKPAR